MIGAGCPQTDKTHRARDTSASRGLSSGEEGHLRRRSDRSPQSGGKKRCKKKPGGAMARLERVKRASTKKSRANELEDNSNASMGQDEAGHRKGLCTTPISTSSPKRNQTLKMGSAGGKEGGITRARDAEGRGAARARAGGGRSRGDRQRKTARSGHEAEDETRTGSEAAGEGDGVGSGERETGWLEKAKKWCR